MGYTGNGAPVLEYTCPKISSADKEDIVPLCAHYAEYVKLFNEGNTGIDPTTLATDNGNRKGAVVSAVAAYYKDGKLIPWTRNLRLPFDPKYLKQLYASTDNWQGTDWETSPHRDNALEIMGKLRWVKRSVQATESYSVSGQYRFYKVFEVPIKVQNEGELGTFHTPTRKAVNDDDREFGAELAAASGI